MKMADDELSRVSSPNNRTFNQNGGVGEAYTNEAYEDNEVRNGSLPNGIRNHSQSVETKNGGVNHVTSNSKPKNGVHRLSNGDTVIENIYSLANHINNKENYFEKKNGLNPSGEKTSEMPKTNLQSSQKQENKDEDGDGDGEDVNEPVNFFSLFRYSSRSDKLLMFIGCIIALCVSTSLPLVIILFGNIVDEFVENHQKPVPNINNVTTIAPTLEPSSQDGNFLPKMAYLCGNLSGVAVGVFCFNYIMVSFFSMAAANQAFKIKCLFMKSVLRQDIGWFDTNQTGDFATRITADLTRVQDGIGEKVCMCIAFLSQTVVSIICALVYGWKLTLVVLCIMPVLSISMAVIAKIQAKVSGNELSSYGAAGAIAEEVLSAIRTVVAFGGESKEIERYDKYLQLAKKQGIKRGLLTSIGAGLVWFCIYCAYALAFWYGVKLIVEGRRSGDPEYNASNLVIVFFNVMMGAMGIGQTAPYFEAFNLARGAASKVFKIIERVPPIDSSSQEGNMPTSLVGDITLKDVHFKYPARPDVQILRGLTLKIRSGETVALVGSSGCGKSTVIQLIQRYYDTEEGHVLIDDNDVKDLNVGWLRDNIGVVGQEPVLFSTTIAENIRYGKSGATDSEIESAAKAANVHDFIIGLPQKYKTLVGERGTQLSGGQKQRIAIARALIRNPKILLLDEATSALDTESESIVQAALDQARQGRTTVIVAHRLSTIRTADKIVAIGDGMVKEIGTHDELMALKGVYYQLVTTQVGDDSEENLEENELENDDVFDENLPALQRTLSVLSSGSCTSDDTNNSRRYSGVERTLSTISTVKHTRQEDNVVVEPSKNRLLKLSLPEWPFLTVGGIAALVTGLFIPLYGILFGEILGLLSESDAKILADITFYSGLFVGMAIGSGISTFLQTFMFTIAGERLTSRLRKMVFTNMISQDMSWFDLPENSIGSLCSRLSSDASQVQGAGGSRISTVLQAMSTLVAAIIIGLYYDWRLGLLVIAFVPIVLLATYFESRIISGHTFSDKTAIEEASKVAIEAIESIRTVASLHQEEAFYIQFSTALTTPLKKSRKSSHVRGLIYGFAQSIPTFAYAAALYYGSVRVSRNEMIYADLFKIMESVIFGTAMVGQAVAFAPDYQKAKTAAVRIFELLDSKPKIDVFSNEGTVLENVSGRIEFKKVYFNYPSRPRVKILRGLNLIIEPGKTVALVGSSGCGKSTCIQLIERFYETNRGKVAIDGKQVESIRVSSLRSKVGLVSQEPILFSYSLAENIAYGDNSRQVSMDEIISAAKNANIHSFISALPQGYSTPVGDKGTQLSGGQKQRIAIARALVRNPKILLLDEATSALDAESEKVVQDALDRASDGRTCVTIAHRLTTIQNADMIAVIHKGQVIEKGTHQELLTLRGQYYNLHNVQSGIK